MDESRRRRVLVTRNWVTPYYLAKKGPGDRLHTQTESTIYLLSQEGCR